LFLTPLFSTVFVFSPSLNFSTAGVILFEIYKRKRFPAIFSIIYLTFLGRRERPAFYLYDEWASNILSHEKHIGGIHVDLFEKEKTVMAISVIFLVSVGDVHHKYNYTNVLCTGSAWDGGFAGTNVYDRNNTVICPCTH
jgi:hypothetical protein